ncbi:hypothetical protein JXR93_13000, partial [bacterium]|nr:hypothetical protein [bacterium]
SFNGDDMKNYYDYWCEGIEYQNCFYWEDAIDSFKEALNIDKTADIYFRLVDCYRALGKVMQAEYCQYMAHSLRVDDFSKEESFIDETLLLENSESIDDFNTDIDTIESDLEIIKKNIIILYAKNSKNIDNSAFKNSYNSKNFEKKSEKNILEDISLKKFKKMILDYAFRKKTLVIKNYFELQPQSSLKTTGY